MKDTYALHKCIALTNSCPSGIPTFGQTCLLELTHFSYPQARLVPESRYSKVKEKNKDDHKLVTEFKYLESRVPEAGFEP